MSVEHSATGVGDYTCHECREVFMEDDLRWDPTLEVRFCKGCEDLPGPLDLLLWYIPPEKRTAKDQAKLDVAFSSLLESIKAAKEPQELIEILKKIPNNKE